MTAPPLKAAEGSRLRPLALLRATPATVWLLVVVQGLLAAFYVVAVPLLHAPDEHAHLDRVVTGPLLTLEADSELSAGVVAALPLVGLTRVDWRVAPGPEPLEGRDAPPRAARPSLDELGGPADSGVQNNADPHPPLYYAAMAAGDAVLHGLDPGAASWDTRTGWLRLLNTLLVAPLPWLAFWIGLRYSRRETVATTAAVLPLAVPQLAHLGGAVNNDNLVTLLATATLLAVVWIATGDDTRRTAALAGLGAGAGMLTKVFAAAAPLWIAAAYALRWWRSRDHAAVATRLGIAAAACVAAGAWWQLRLLAVEGTIAPRSFGYPSPAAVDAPLLPWIGEAVARLSRSFWGFFGVEQYVLPDVVVVAATVAALGTVAVGLAAPPAGRRRALAWLLALPVLTTLVIVLTAALRGYLRSGLPVGLHGRYLFLGLVGGAVLAASGAGRLLPRPVLPLAALAAAAAMQVLGAWTVLDGFWGGDGVTGRLDTLAAWAPWHPGWLLAGGVLLAAALAAAAMRLARPATHR